MKFLHAFLSALCLLCLTAAPASAQDDAAEASGQQPPLIDRQLFFGNPEISGAQLSPDGQQIAFIKPYEDTRNIWVKSVGEPFDAARPLTADDRPVPGFFWSQDSEVVLYVQDKGGNENYHVYAVDPSGEPTDSTGAPPARDLTPVEGVRAQIYAVPEDAPGTMIVGLNDRDARWHDVYRLDIESGERELLVENDDEIAGWTTDLDGDVRLATRTTESGGTEVMRVGQGGALSDPVYTCGVEETCGPIRFHEDGAHVYMRTNKGPQRDLQELVLFDPQNGDAETIASDPEGEVDFGGAIFSEKTDELIGTVYIGDRQRIYPKDAAFEQDLERLRAQLPEGNLGITSSTEDMRHHTVSVSSDVDPGSVYLYDRETGQTERLYRSRPELPSENLASMKAIRYQARDGLEIPAYLTLPKGKAPEDLPVVINPHGGPWARDTWGYSAYAQFLANRGYAVLQPNFRGSTGYGQDFLNAGNGEWGDAMQDDLTDGAQYLVDEGIADPERIGIFGGSYGGYATLAGLAFTPQRYAAGVSYVGPSNLITLMNSIPPYWASIRRVFNVRMGDIDDPEDRARLKRQSPLFSADQIQAPLLVIQGANDPRVDKRESDQIVVALRERGFPVQYLVAPDEGHGFRSRANRLAVAAAMEEFLAGHLGGRYQQEMTPEIQQQLQSITVDPASVTLPDSLEMAQAEAAQTAPLPDADGSLLAPGTMQYRTALSVQGREINVDVTRTLAEATFEGQPVWRVVDRAETPLGASSDTVQVNRKTLRTMHRLASQGGGTVELRFSDDAVTGAINAGGQSIDVNTDLEAPVLSDGVGLETFVAGLPLEDGYEATVRTFNPQQQQAVPMTLAVTGTESVETPAGTFETFVVELTPVDGGDTRTLHVRQEAPHTLVKKEQPLPAQMGSGTATTVLQSMEDGASEADARR